MHFTKSNTSCNEISFNSNYSTNITLHEKKMVFIVVIKIILNTYIE